MTPASGGLAREPQGPADFDILFPFGRAQDDPSAHPAWVLGVAHPRQTFETHAFFRAEDHSGGDSHSGDRVAVGLEDWPALRESYVA
jgi:hypothetical protein